MKLIAIMALTADGKIGVHDSHFPDWTGKEDKQLFKRLTMRSGVIIMGAKTFETIGKPLPGRKNIVLTRNPARQSCWENLIYTSQAPGELLYDLKKEGFKEVVLAGGAKVNTLFAKAGLIDEFVITYAPKIFGQGISLFSEPVSMDLRLKDLKEMENGVIYTHYEVLSPLQG